MELTDAQRLILVNQLEILMRLKPTAEEKRRYGRAQHILLNGYEFLYDEANVVGTLSPPVSEAVSKKVYEVFEMFRILDAAIEKLPQGQKSGLPESSLRFSGFDGNHETDYMAFARFLCHEMNLFTEQKKSKFNSHCPMVATYNRMLGTFVVVKKDFDFDESLSKEALEKVAEARKLKK